MPMFDEDCESPHSPLQTKSTVLVKQKQQNGTEHLNLSSRYEQIKELKKEWIESKSASDRIPEATLPTRDGSDRGDMIVWPPNDRNNDWSPKAPENEVPGGQSRLTDSYRPYAPLLPSPSFKQQKSTDEDEARNQTGLQIDRPRSALHTGDFTESNSATGFHSRNGTSHSQQLDFNPWQSTSPPRQFVFPRDNKFSSHGDSSSVVVSRRRTPSVSSSLSSSFVLKAPTSPLVQAHTNDEPESLHNVDAIDIDMAFGRNSRRHTLHSTNSSFSSFFAPFSAARAPPSLRRDYTFPYQAHQPRRSLTSNSFSQPPSTPQTPLSRSRRPSFSEGSPLHASMVGSYEESILRGRMSTTPSKPLDFLAQIGVLGLGKCKANLRCPPHVTVPFPAVFYSYDTTSHGRAARSSDEPSPYVGQIDLENNLPHQPHREKRRKRAATKAPLRTEVDGLGETRFDLDLESEEDHKRTQKVRRRSPSPRAPAGGSYRIPEKGQLQIIIKNPNKTAVKLFLIPYDLAGMEPGTKTFIRQRSYSVGPVVDVPMAAIQSGSLNADRPVLRYLVHLQICSPSPGRFYLHKSIRIVFANRVPDGKEKLRNEISLPTPRFTAYKPGRDHGSNIPSSTGAGVAAEIAQRRRSAGFSLSSIPHFNDAFAEVERYPTREYRGTSQNDLFGGDTSPIQPIPIHFGKASVAANNLLRDDGPMQLYSPSSSKSSRPTTSSQSDNVMSWGAKSSLTESYNKLKRGDAGYGGNVFGERAPGSVGGEGLLAKKLKDLEVQRQ